MRKFIVTLLIFNLTFFMGQAVFAASTQGSITIKSTVKDKTYELYKIMDLTYTQKDRSPSAAYTVSDDWVAFFEGGPGTSFLLSSKEDDDCRQIHINGEVRYIRLDEDGLADFAEAALTFAARVRPDRRASGTGSDVKVENLALGYYLVYPVGATEKDTSPSICSITSTLPDGEVEIKAGYPSIDKKIQLADGTLTDKSTASVGDKVYFIITGKVPDMTGYDRYTYTIKDDMPYEFAFNNDWKVTIDGKDVNPTAYVIGYDLNYRKQIMELSVSFSDFIKFKEYAGKDIVITYSATLSERAFIGDKGNINGARLEYSSSPKSGWTSETPKIITTTYTAGIRLTKTDAESPDRTLSGAKFKIERADGADFIPLINDNIYRLSDEGTFYMKKDGTYTKTPPSENTKDQYDDENYNKKFENIDYVYRETVRDGIMKEGYVGNDGILSLKGLGAGTYNITELIAPDGYNLLAKPIRVEISFDKNKGLQAEVDGKPVAVDDGIIAVEVQNSSGRQLPGTGGAGRAPFYIIGGLLMIGAVTLLITKRKL